MHLPAMQVALSLAYVGSCETPVATRYVNYTPLTLYANTNKEVRRMMWSRTSKGMIRSP
jgi:hypothetical protein